LTISHTVRQSTCISEEDPDLSIRGAVLVQTPFFLKISKDTDKAKITRHSKKKNDKDETGNVLLNLIYFYPSIA
jgi:hypothetical protein